VGLGPVDPGGARALALMCGCRTPPRGSGVASRVRARACPAAPPSTGSAGAGAGDESDRPCMPLGPETPHEATDTWWDGGVASWLWLSDLIFLGRTPPTGQLST
jgi:hypothetical protein